MTDVFKTVVLIPSLHPDHLLTDYVDALNEAGFHRIVIVDDGSGEDEKYQRIFRALREVDGCHVIGYAVNQGKGYALRYGIRYIQESFPDAPGIVTADSDGQHTAKDVLAVAAKMLESPSGLVIGSRDFNAANIPPKSRFGNKLTSFFFAVLYGHWLPDTQTGLRGFTLDLSKKMLQIPGNRFEYEMNMLIHLSADRVPFHIVTIDTIYLEANKSTHFRPLHDSLRIYKQLFGNFFHYASASLASALVDLVLFTLMDQWLIPWVFRLSLGDYAHNLLAVAIARIGSTVFNYNANRLLVFKQGGGRRSALRYALLAIINILVSGCAVSLLSAVLPIPKTIIYILVCTVMYVINYRVQRTWVFR